MVAHVSEESEIIRVLDDSERNVINFVTSVAEFDGDLFFASLSRNFVVFFFFFFFEHEMTDIRYYNT